MKNGKLKPVTLTDGKDALFPVFPFGIVLWNLPQKADCCSTLTKSLLQRFLSENNFLVDIIFSLNFFLNKSVTTELQNQFAILNSSGVIWLRLVAINPFEM